MNDVLEDDLAYLGSVWETASEFLITYGFQIFGAIIILLIGWWLSNRAGIVALKICQRTGLDITLAKFLANIARTVVLVFIVILALNKFGISIAPFVAAVGAIAFGATLAVQGSLSNYGAGLTLIMTRPFVVGDTIRIQGVSGLVEEIRLAYTLLTNEDGETILVPNRHIIGEILHNTRSGLLIESSVGISYGNDPDTAINVINTVLEDNAAVVNDPQPQVGIEAFGDSSIDIGYRYWAPTKLAFQTQYAVNNRVFTDLKTAGITIPFPTARSAHA
ncbi:MAG: mechanosensitive ion channel family protein [Gammaproteobacteria bacterium]